MWYLICWGTRTTSPSRRLLLWWRRSPQTCSYAASQKIKPGGTFHVFRSINHPSSPCRVCVTLEIMRIMREGPTGRAASLSSSTHKHLGQVDIWMEEHMGLPLFAQAAPYKNHEDTQIPCQKHPILSHPIPSIETAASARQCCQFMQWLWLGSLDLELAGCAVKFYDAIATISSAHLAIFNRRCRHPSQRCSHPAVQRSYPNQVMVTM